jgi:hypothetical protein
MNKLKFILSLIITLNCISFSSFADKYIVALSSHPVAYDTQKVSARHIPYVDFLNKLAFNAEVDIDASINTKYSVYGHTIEIISAWSLPVKKSFISSFNSGVEFGKNSPYESSIFHKNLKLSVTDKLGPFLNKNRYDNFDSTRENYALFICFKVGDKVIKKPITTYNGNIRSIVNGEKDEILIPLFVKAPLTFDYWFEVGLLNRKGDDKFNRVESL